MAKKRLYEQVLRIEPGISLGQWIYERLTNNWMLLLSLSGGSGMGYLASITTALEPYSPVVYGAIGLGAFFGVWVLAAFAGFLRAAAGKRRAERETIEKWTERVHAFNPLAREFTSQRIRLADLAHPISKLIDGKRLINCEVLGPSNLVMSRNSKLEGVTFYNCTVVILRPDIVNNVPLANAIGFKDSHMLGGSLWNCTIFAPPQMAEAFIRIGLGFLSLSGDPEIDSRPQPNIGQKIQP